MGGWLNADIYVLFLCSYVRKVSLVKSDKDTRYGVGAVVSHDGVQMPCVAVPNLAAFRAHIGEEQYRQVRIAISCFGKLFCVWVLLVYIQVIALMPLLHLPTQGTLPICMQVVQTIKLACL